MGLQHSRVMKTQSLFTCQALKAKELVYLVFLHHCKITEYKKQIYTESTNIIPTNNINSVNLKIGSHTQQTLTSKYLIVMHLSL